MQLVLSAAVGSFGKVLQQLDVLDARMGNAGFQVFSEFVIDDVDSAVSFGFGELSGDIFVDIDNVESFERVEAASCSKLRVQFLEFL